MKLFSLALLLLSTAEATKATRPFSRLWARQSSPSTRSGARDSSRRRTVLVELPLHSDKPSLIEIDRSLSDILRVRGGGNLGGAIVGTTAAIGAVTGTSMYLGTESFTKFLWLGLNKFPHDKYIGMAMIGWSVGKLSAVMSGPEATTSFARLNCIPLFLWLLANFQTKAAITTSILPAILFAAYIFAGFIDSD